MKKLNGYQFLLSFSLCAFILCLSPTEIFAQKAACCEAGKVKEDLEMGAIKFPDIELLNQDGETVQLTQLVKDKVVAMNFVFTTCTTICPPMGANFIQLKKLMGAHVDKDLVMISVSIDPTNDTPQRLKAWSENFNPGSGWNLLTGDKSVVDQLLKSLKVFTPLKEDHAPILIMGKQGAPDWIRTNGLADPATLADALNAYLNKTADVEPKALDENDLHYFTNTVLVNQYGEEMKFYEDLLYDKIVVINPFFSECPGSCPVMHNKMKEIQAHLGDRLGKDVHLISITVDPKVDRPEILGEYAQRFEAERGWYFLSGDVENVEMILKKLGKNVSNREEHDTIFLIGNIPTKLWKKANGLADTKEVIKTVDSVIQDIE